MTAATTKANIGLTLVVLFLITLVTGIVLHLKKHGIVLEPRSVIKIIHWAAGFLMVAFTCWHARQFWAMFCNLKKPLRWFWGDTWILIITIGLTFITGAIKLFSPEKIPHLGL